MLRDRLTTYLSEIIREQKKTNSDLQHIELHKQEKDYIEQHNMSLDDITIMEKDAVDRFNNAYIERCEKDTEELIAEESTTFLDTPIIYLKQHKNEFIYLESSWFNLIGVDGVSLESDDVFGTYNTMFGLKVQKKYEEVIRTYLKQHLIGIDTEPEMLFNHNDGIWDVNIPLNYINGFNSELNIGEAFRLFYNFLFSFVEFIEVNYSKQ